MNILVIAAVIFLVVTAYELGKTRQAMKFEEQARIDAKAQKAIDRARRVSRQIENRN